MTLPQSGILKVFPRRLLLTGKGFVFTGHLLSVRYDLRWAVPILVRVLYHRRYSAALAWHSLPLLMLLFLRSCAVAASCCATSPLLNSTRSISFNAVLSLCYRVIGHAIGICHQCVPSWCLALTAHSPIFSVALPPGLSGYTPEVLHLRKAICALLLVLLSLVLNLYSPLCPRPAR